MGWNLRSSSQVGNGRRRALHAAALVAVLPVAGCTVIRLRDTSPEGARFTAAPTGEVLSRHVAIGQWLYYATQRFDFRNGVDSFAHVSWESWQEVPGQEDKSRYLLEQLAHAGFHNVTAQPGAEADYVVAGFYVRKNVDSAWDWWTIPAAVPAAFAPIPLVGNGEDLMFLVLYDREGNVLTSQKYFLDSTTTSFSLWAFMSGWGTLKQPGDVPAPYARFAAREFAAMIEKADAQRR